MQIRLHVDEDAMARPPVRGLRARGIDVTTVLDAGMSEQDDLAQLEHATQHGRVLYTFNVGHFCRLHSIWLKARIIQESSWSFANAVLSVNRSSGYYS